MSKSILYLGDTELKSAASYLAGIMTFYDISFDYLPSDQKLSDSLLNAGYQVVIISDYPANNFSPEQLNSLTEMVSAGTGLLMIGGWESFTGPNREYNDTVLKEVLPVVMKDSDDRINCPQPCLVEKTADHKIIDSLPFDEKPPAIGGFNQFQSKPEASTILVARRFNVSRNQNEFTFTPFQKPDPLLVLGSFGKGRVAAFASDVAPHWVGGLVDWGDSRVVQAQAPAAEAIEVGNWYAELFANMIDWTAGKL
ncbi:MAG: glutamine amidotransferase [Planctomycetota bacterium]|jgi:uncharacterized membrane protein